MRISTIFAALLTLVALLGDIPTAAACRFDIDCQIGSRCVKQSNSLYGVCMGGLNPGNAYDKKPVYDPLDLNKGRGRTASPADGTYGDTCQFDLDCGIGRRCVKVGYSVKGTCAG